LYYRLTQAGHRELVVDEVWLDASSAVCFQAQQRLMGGIGFEPGEAQLGDTGRKQNEGSVGGIVKALAAWRGRGNKPTLVLHAFAAKDEAPDAQMATELARKRADAVRAWLMERGVKADQLSVQAHGWELAAAPLRDDTPLRPMRTVEISSERSPPSQAVRSEGPPPDAQALAKLQQRVRALQAQGETSEVSLHAPRLLIESRDGKGFVTIRVALATASDEARALQRYFVQGTADGCAFGGTQ
jgi:hypothetical protein